jgi:hypothetical protein
MGFLAKTWLFGVLVFFVGLFIKNGLVSFFAVVIPAILTLFSFPLKRRVGRYRYVNDKIKGYILKDQMYHCAWRGCMEKDNLELHHIKPLSKGGDLDNPNNLVYLCPNHHARAHTLKDFVAMLNKRRKLFI